MSTELFCTWRRKPRDSGETSSGGGKHRYKVVIDTNIHSEIGIGHHLDYSIFDEGGKLLLHTPFTSDATPDDITQWATRFADELEQSPPQELQGHTEYLQRIINILRSEAQKGNQHRK